MTITRGQYSLHVTGPKRRFMKHVNGTRAVVGADRVRNRSAHHSYAAFDLESTVSIEGELSDVVWAKPHVLMTITTEETVGPGSPGTPIRVID
jgi:hypothetical protein